jgi:hypothetical protein
MQCVEVADMEPDSERLSDQDVEELAELPGEATEGEVRALVREVQERRAADGDWISVEERLPGADRYVLVWTQKLYWEWARCVNGRWTVSGRVSHWREAPKGPGA